MAALAHHHRVLLSFTSFATPRTHLPCASSSPPPTHARLRGARVLRHASGGGGSSSAAPVSSSSLEELSRSCTTWSWRGMRVNYLVRGEGPPVLLVHGFGASVAHWRRNIGVLSESNTVYAIDLLGFGASDKPAGFSYTMETWAELILEFLDEVVKRPTVLVGNSVGSLACVIAASEIPLWTTYRCFFANTQAAYLCIDRRRVQAWDYNAYNAMCALGMVNKRRSTTDRDSTRDLVRGLVLLNCSGGMNNKAIVDDWRIKLLLPLLWLIDFLLKQKSIASALFGRVKERHVFTAWFQLPSPLPTDMVIGVQIIRGPADTEGALDAFVSTVTGPPGPSPIALMPRIKIPVLVLWGDEDPFTPIDGPVGKYFSGLPSELPNVRLYMLEGVGHCPHDDRPDLVHEKLLPWLASLPSAAEPEVAVA
uniref:Uncharacterized protein n=1 Tax=Aegilops tauschii TaxID=37682 RepID=N1QY94_AEGTA